MGAAPNESQTSVGGLVLKIAVPTVGLMLMFKALGGYQEAQVDLSTPEMSKEAIAKRIKPVGQISMPEAAPAGAAAVAKVEKSGEEVFNAVCTACHTTGAAGAPKFGDKGAWGARIAQGYDTLVENGGKLDFTYKSEAEDIKDVFGISKKAFKASLNLVGCVGKL